jgi:hypothetical protein
MALSRSRLKVLQNPYDRLERHVKSKSNSGGKLDENLFQDSRFNGLDPNFCNLISSYDSSDTDVLYCRGRYNRLIEFVRSEMLRVSEDQES